MGLSVLCSPEKSRKTEADGERIGMEEASLCPCISLGQDCRLLAPAGLDFALGPTVV